MLTTKDPIGDIMSRLIYLENNGGLFQRTLNEIVIQNGYANNTTYNLFHKPINRGGRTFDLVVSVISDLNTDQYRYTVFDAGFGNLDYWYDRPFNPEYNGGFPIGLYVVGYERNNLILIGASSNSDYQY